MANNGHAIPVETLQEARKVVTDMLDYLDSLKSELHEIEAQFITT